MQAWFRSSRFLLIFISIWLFLCSTVRYLSVPDEGRYADISRIMYESGDWLVPRLNDLPFIHKPPLLHWISSLLMHIFGVHVWVVRLVPVLAACAMLIGTFLFVRRYISEKVAEISVLILSTNLLFFGSSQYVNHDLLLATGITLCVFCLVDFTLSQRKSMLFLGYFFGAAAFLTKGLIGILIPSMILLPWLIYTQQFKRIPAFFNPLALIFLGVLIGPWLYSMQHQYPNFLHYFFIEQQFDRFHSEQFNNKRPWFFYLVILCFSFLPWLMGLRIRSYKTAFSEQHISRLIQSLLFWWSVSVSVFFSIPPSKLAGYILPAIAPLTIICSVWLEQSLKNTISLTRVQKYGPATFLIILGSVLASTLHLIKLDFVLSSTQQFQIIFMTSMLIIIPLVLLRLFNHRKIEYIHYVAGSLIILCTTIPFIVKIFDIKNNHDQLNFTQYIQPQSKIVFYENYFYDIPFMLDLKHPVYVVNDWQADQSDNSALELRDGLKFEPEQQKLLWSRQQFQNAIQQHENLIVITSAKQFPLDQQASQIIHNRNFNVFIFKPIR